MDFVGVFERKTLNAALLLSGAVKTAPEYINYSQSSIQDKCKQFNSYLDKIMCCWKLF